MPEIKSVNWESIQVMFGLVSAAVTAATVYLRLFIGKQIAESEERTLRHIDQKFTTKEVADLRISAIEQRVSKLERNGGAVKT